MTHRPRHRPTDRSRARSCRPKPRPSLALVDRLDENFDRAVRMLYECQGRVIVTGMGKSGIICRKIAATLASTGTSAFFLHPAEATHGDLGVIQPSDVLLAISHSGETQEVLRLLEAIRRIGARIVAITGNPGVDARAGRRRLARLPGLGGSVPAQSRADRKHHRRARDGRRALHDAARRKGIPRRGLREDSSGRQAGQEADARRSADARRRRRADRHRSTRRCATSSTRSRAKRSA